jgi:O-acetylhomoserine (thiol)-lyase
MAEKKWRFDTQVVHAGQSPGEWKQTTLAPIYQSASHKFDTAEELSEVFAGKRKGFIYQRLRNPSNETLENKLTALEGGLGAVVTSSGMAAITLAVMAIAKAGDEIVSGNSLFMSTYLLFANVLPKYGITTQMVETADLEEYEPVINDKTKLIFVETIGNPKMDVPHIKKLAAIAHKHNLPLIVDNTLATPYLFRPFEHDADIVIHSTTKYLNGHGSAVGGVIIDSGGFEWPKAKFPDFVIYKETMGGKAFLDKVWRELHINFGTTQAPFHSFLTMIGLDTLSLRMERHLQNTQKVAEYLAEHPQVTWVNYPGLAKSPYHATAKEQFGGKGYGGLLTFGLKDQAACFDYIRKVKLAYHLANLGDCKTLVIHPASSQYVRFDEPTRQKLGIPSDMVRVSVGIEALEDILEDFDQALK